MSIPMTGKNTDRGIVRRVNTDYLYGLDMSD